MTPRTHSTAIIDPSATVAPGVTIGPYAVIGPGVELGEGVAVGPHAVIAKDTIVGSGSVISQGAAVGSDPQDLKYGGEKSYLRLGARVQIREFSTVNRGTAGGSTVIEDGALVMAYVHVAHDCRVGRGAVLVNGVTLAGHVDVGDWALIGGLTPVIQFARIGEYAMVGGASRMDRDVAPFTIASGSPPFTSSINRVGLERRGFGADAIEALQTAFREIFRSGRPVREAAAGVVDGAATGEVRRLAEFVSQSRRGVPPPAGLNSRSGPDDPGAHSS